MLQEDAALSSRQIDISNTAGMYIRTHARYFWYLFNIQEQAAPRCVLTMDPRTTRSTRDRPDYRKDGIDIYSIQTAQPGTLSGTAACVSDVGAYRP